MKKNLWNEERKVLNLNYIKMTGIAVTSVAITLLSVPEGAILSNDGVKQTMREKS